MESMWKYMGTNSSSKVVINHTMIIDSILMTICMSPFSNPLLSFDSMLKFSTFTNFFFGKYYSCIFNMRWFDLKNDYGQRCHVQQIIMQICIAWIFSASIFNLIQGAIPIEHLCLTSKSKSFITTTIKLLSLEQ
jgi:hypothetical protein